MTQQAIDSAGSPQSDEPPLRYHSARQMIGVPTLPQQLRTLAGGGLLFGPPPLLMRLLARRGQRQALHVLERWWSRRLFALLGIRFDVAGLEHIDPHERYVVTPLHEGFADVPALMQLPLPLRFAARDELFGWRVIGPYLHDTGQIRVTPERGSWSYRQLLLQARGVFACGESLVMFPQGTILGIETDFLRGAFALAQSLHRPLLPIAVTGSHRVWEHPYTPRLRYGQRISLRILPPVSAAEVCAEHIDALRVTVRRRLKAAALSGTMATPRHFVPARDGYWDGFAYQIDPDFPALATKIAQHRQQVAAQRRALETPAKS